MENKYNLNYIKENNLILLSVTSGSHAYGTNISTSDVDERGIYIAEVDDFLCGNYPEQINDEKNDITYYELGRFLNLVSTNNPNILELLSTPKDCIKYKHPLFDEIIKHKKDFITLKCRHTFGSYASAQIKKAKGLNKKQNIEQGSVTRKDVLDFCYVIQGEQSVLWKKWCEGLGYEEKFLGITNVPHAKDLYAVFYDNVAAACFGEFFSDEQREFMKNELKSQGKAMGFGYKGLAKVGGSDNAAESNQLRLSSIPKGETPICNIMFNKDGYTAHCKDYKEYMEWVENRNTARYVDTVKHGQQIDGKNMMHCMRLIRMTKEIGRGEGIQVRRADREELLAIRRGEVDLETLIETAEAEIKEMDIIFEDSDLPKSIDPKLVNNLLIKIRREFYGL